jgi:hypothetical protein
VLEGKSMDGLWGLMQPHLQWAPRARCCGLFLLSFYRPHRQGSRELWLLLVFVATRRPLSTRGWLPSHRHPLDCVRLLSYILASSFTSCVASSKSLASLCLSISIYEMGAMISNVIGLLLLLLFWQYWDVNSVFWLLGNHPPTSPHPSPFCCNYFSHRAFSCFCLGLALDWNHSTYTFRVSGITEVNHHAQFICWDGESLTNFFAWAGLEWCSSWSTPPK